MLKSKTTKSLLNRQAALPSDHGSWVFLLSPLLIGIFVGGRLTSATAILVTGTLAAFLLRQPFILATKAYAGRRSRNILPAARFWMVVYGLIAAISLFSLVAQGYAYLFFLVIPGVFVFGWYLWLVSKRSERHQLGVDIIASGALALAAPAAQWVSAGQPLQEGWWLWILTWLQSAASIVYAFMRLEQRSWATSPGFAKLLSAGRRVFLYSSFNLVAVIVFGISGKLPTLLWVPYALQWVETGYGIYYPAIGKKPTSIGIRQLIISSVFTILFVLFWNR